MSLGSIFILTLIVFCVCIVVSYNVHQNKRTSDSKRRYSKEQEINKLKTQLERSIKEKEARERERKEQEQKELELKLNQVKCQFKLRGLQDKTIIAEWFITHNPSNVDYTGRLYRTRNKGWDGSNQSEATFLKAEIGERGGYKDTYPRKKGGEFYYTLILYYEGKQYFLEEKQFTVDATMERKIDQMERDVRYFEHVEKFGKAQRSAMKAGRKVNEEFVKYANSDIASKEAAEEVGYRPVQEKPSRLFKKILQKEQSQVIENIRYSYVKKIKKLTKDKVKIKSEIKLAFSDIISDPQFSDDFDKFEALEELVKEFTKLSEVKIHSIDVAILLFEVDEEAYKSIYQEDAIDFDALEQDAINQLNK